MKQVYISGSIKDGARSRSVQLEGWMQGDIFYPDKNNARIFYTVVTCHKNWKQGILADYIEEIDDD